MAMKQRAEPYAMAYVWTVCPLKSVVMPINQSTHLSLAGRQSLPLASVPQHNPGDKETAMNNVRIWDNDSKTFDRYTVQIDRDIFTMSDNPLSPQGVNLYDGTLAKNESFGMGFDKRVKLNDLPKDVQTAIRQRIAQ